MRKKIFPPGTFFALCLIGLLLLLIIPLPPFLLDILLSFSLVLGVMTLLLALHIEKVLEFSSFPSLLLFLTLFRLGLNIASTRLILAEGQGGSIIQTFGEFASSNNLIVGLTIFALLTIINFIVVTKGSGRIAEVSARFALEALPGKQMAIDADLSSGNLTQAEARVERERLNSQAEFYGAMDGASKFVRGDAIASVVITLVNLCGGFCIGILKNDLSLTECLTVYTRLTIGDGLVSQIPALLISVGAATMVTRSSAGSVGLTLPQQLLQRPSILFMGGVTLLCLSFVPGMPWALMLPISLLLGGFGIFGARKGPKIEIPTPEEAEGEDKKIEEALLIHPIAIYLGSGLLIFGKSLLEEVPEIRRSLAKRLGIVIPHITIQDQLTLGASSYLIKIKGIKVAVGEARSVKDLHSSLYKVLQENASELLNREGVAKMIETAKLYDAAVVEELIPHKINHGQILKVLQNLLKEKVSIRDFVTILEVLADHIQPGVTVDTDLMTEHVRQGLSKIILENLISEKGKLHAITLDPKVEQTLASSFKKNNFGNSLILRPQTLEKLKDELSQFMKRAEKEKIQAIVLTSVSSRRSLRFLIEKHLPDLPVLSFGEIEGEMEIESLGVISNEVLI